MNSEVKSAGRILDLLEYLSQRREAVSLSQIIRDLGFPKSSAHGLLQTLTARGHVTQDDATPSSNPAMAFPFVRTRSRWS